MRLKRLCTPTGKGKLHVSQEVAEQWQEGNREELQLALVKAIKQYGYENNHATLTAVRARFVETDHCCRASYILTYLDKISLAGRVLEANAKAERDEVSTGRRIGRRVVY